MKFVKVDEDAYEVTMNLDTIREIGESLSEFVSSGSGPERAEAIGNGFVSAYKRLSQPETSEEVVESSDEQ